MQKEISNPQMIHFKNPQFDWCCNKVLTNWKAHLFKNGIACTSFILHASPISSAAFLAAACQWAKPQGRNPSDERNQNIDSSTNWLNLNVLRCLNRISHAHTTHGESTDQQQHSFLQRNLQCYRLRARSTFWAMRKHHPLGHEEEPMNDWLKVRYWSSLKNSFYLEDGKRFDKGDENLWEILVLHPIRRRCSNRAKLDNRTTLG